jgi:hypothetical protein
VQQPAAKNENSYALILAPLRSAIGMLGLEKWGNGGIAGLHDCMIDVHPCNISQYPNTPLFHFPIIPGWNKQDGTGNSLLATICRISAALK